MERNGISPHFPTGAQANFMISALKKACKNPGLIPTHAAYLCRVLWRRISNPPAVKVIKSGTTWYRYKKKLYPAHLNSGNAVSYIKEYALKFCQGTGLDIGASQWPLPGAQPVENNPGCNAYKLDSFDDSSLDFVFSSHCLEHLDQWRDALALWIKKLKKDGILFLYLPHKSMKLWHPRSPWVGHEHKWIPTADVIHKYLAKQGMHIIEYSSKADAYWSWFSVSRKG